MAAVTKKRIVIFFSDILTAGSVFFAATCLFVKLRSSFCHDYFGRVGIFAAQSVFSGGSKFFKMPVLIFKGNSAVKNNNANAPCIKDNTPHNQIITSQEPRDITLPEFAAESSQINHEGELKHKIIESQFGSGGIKHENFYVKNTTGQDIDIASEMAKSPDITIKNTKEPQVLIVHTHTSESYMDEDSGFFYESFYPRSLDGTKNVTAVGKIITEKLIQNGINTIHSTVYHDNPTYNGSYARAAKTIKEILDKNPSVQIVIDIHRDSMGSKETGKIKPTFRYKDKKAAQLMIISGCDPDGSLGFPEWRKNLRLALRVQKYCETMFPGITRPLNFSKVKYNENLTPGSLLIEIGSDANTLEEAVYTGAMLGEALSQLLKDIQK